MVDQLDLFPWKYERTKLCISELEVNLPLETPMILPRRWRMLLGMFPTFDEYEYRCA